MSSNYHGLVLVDKPSGWTSHDLVNWGRKIFSTREVGHCGTLDPIASGLMVLLIGEATKLSQYILEQDKAYKVGIQFGLGTDTLDIAGAVLEKKVVDIPEAKIKETALSLLGEFNFPVPMFSAVKVDGTRMHEYARKGQTIEQPMKMMKFWDISFLNQSFEQMEVHLHCSKGSYVRSWVYELGQRLGCGAVVNSLVRTQSQPYRLEQALTTEKIQKLAAENELKKCLIPIENALTSYKLVRVFIQDEGMLRNGQISNGLKTQLISVFKPGVDIGIRAVSQQEGKLLALINIDPDKGFVIRRGFRY